MSNNTTCICSLLSDSDCHIAVNDTETVVQSQILGVKKTMSIWYSYIATEKTQNMTPPY